LGRERTVVVVVVGLVCRRRSSGAVVRPGADWTPPLVRNRLGRDAAASPATPAMIPREERRRADGRSRGDPAGLPESLFAGLARCVRLCHGSLLVVDDDAITVP
jgi:hypothetical protein